MPVDAISLEVFKNLFAAVAEEMGLTLRRASFSPNIRERLDFSCAVFDADARMIAQAAHIPVHLGSMPASVAAALAEFEEFFPGDLVVLNDPYRGGTHLPDITMISPIFAGGDLSYFVASRAHHADVGGMTPGSAPLSTELYQEGIIIPPLKLRLSGWMNEGAIDLIVANSRNPAERLGDLEAQLAAHRIGEQRLLDMMIEHGPEATSEHGAALLAYSRRLTQSVIAGIPDGVYHFRDAMEGDGQAEFEIPIQARIEVHGESMTVDFSGSAPQVLGNVNAVPAIVRSATWYCVRLLAAEDIPVNHGCFQPVEVITPAGSFLNPRFPAAVVVGNTETSQRVVDTVLGALAQALPELVPAASLGTMNNFAVGGFDGEEQFVYYETLGGGHGASSQGDGLSGRHCHMTNTLNTPVEALEYSLPLRVRRYQLRAGSGGGGQRHGGDGITREYELLAPATITINSERRLRAPYGLNGGEAGKPGLNTVIRNGAAATVGGKHLARLDAGDRVIIETPGGGGWGKP